ncbi:hypothetical protein SARC_01361 [Sphaeroforma arctica JP610]|uniref:RING-type domain-containing protein n=1 Tax=Sphaeroforma arctica JP610 TaxID=667725 RepID=A0A0L0GBX0_9EUKA|nr:hypothetical protein SARC_01361 [Sphaeroforma arctica JP610]KNC86490.1 hypothetical protein SARC_01361 [Sphaeroforma arctica JP610]|eukprot:XP_014160392.1 hypothetical protein SARC_01361 [Sphaeroforma arctica JP610]
MLSQLRALGRAAPRAMTLLNRQAFRPGIGFHTSQISNSAKVMKSTLTLATRRVPNGQTWSHFFPKWIKPRTQRINLRKAFGGVSTASAAGISLGLSIFTAPAMCEPCRESVESAKASYSKIWHKPRSLEEIVAVYAKHTSMLTQEVADLKVNNERMISTLLLNEARIAAASETTQMLREELESTRNQHISDIHELEDARIALAEMNENLDWKLEASHTCVICMEDPRAMRFDCGHLIACRGCTDLLVDKGHPCPMCRSSIGDPLPVFVS